MHDSLQAEDHAILRMAWDECLLYEGLCSLFHRLRPYHVENTSSRLITEVKQRRAWLVLGWVTAWEYQVL